MKARLESDGSLLIRLSPADGSFYSQLMERVRAADPLRYAKRKFNEKDHPRVERPPEHAGEFAVKIDKKEVAAHPYHSMESFPTFADTPEKKAKLEQHAKKELKTWREAATARVDMSITERQKHNKILDPAFKALKMAFLDAESKQSWDAAAKRRKAEQPEIEIPKAAKRKVAAVKVKMKTKKVSKDDVKKAIKKKVKK